MAHDEEDVELTRTHRPGEAREPDAGAQTWGGFQLLEELGHGAFGRVYHARDETLARDIALKIIRLPDPAHAATALHEGRMLARVRHRNVVTVHGARQVGDEVGFWMELIHGRPLGQLIAETGPLGPEEATVVGISLCQALAAVHAAGLLHRDIKANNVMRESGGRIVLMDFGAGRDVSHAAVEDFAGTPVYMAPEVLAGSPASIESDLYSLGVLLFFAVTGVYPIGGRSVLDLLVAHRAGRQRLLADVRPDLPDGFVQLSSGRSPCGSRTGTGARAS
jgi:serine/threonine-protein kinase